MKQGRTDARPPEAPEIAAESSDPRPDVGRAPEERPEEDRMPGAESADLPAADEAEARRVELELELARAKDGWLRAEADLANVRRRAARELDDAERRGFERALLGIVTFADDLERALEAAGRAGESDSALAQGVALVLRNLGDNLAASGVAPIEPLGAPFDPREHEALLSAPSAEHEAGVVTQVIARGWRQGDRLVRPARVVVSSGPPPAEGAPPGAEGGPS